MRLRISIPLMNMNCIRKLTNYQMSFLKIDLDKIFNEYNKLENENIVVKKKGNKDALNNFSKQLDKINKYPSLNFDEFSSLDTYFFTNLPNHSFN